jgi:glutaredoxin
MKLKAWLKEKGVDFENKDVSSDQANAAEMQEKSGQLSVPVIDIGGKIIVGFAPEEMEAELAKIKKTKKE